MATSGRPLERERGGRRFSANAKNRRFGHSTNVRQKQGAMTFAPTIFLLLPQTFLVGNRKVGKQNLPEANCDCVAKHTHPGPPPSARNNRRATPAPPSPSCWIRSAAALQSLPGGNGGDIEVQKQSALNQGCPQGNRNTKKSLFANNAEP